MGKWHAVDLYDRLLGQKCPSFVLGMWGICDRLVDRDVIVESQLQQ